MIVDRKYDFWLQPKFNDKMKKEENMKKVLLAISLVISIAILGGCGTPGKKVSVDSANQKGMAKGDTKITWNMEYEPKTLDPQKSTDVSASEMSFACLEG